MSPEQKQWAVYLRQRTPGEMRIERFFDGPELHHIDVMTFESEEGVVVGTIGVMEVELSDDEKQSVRCELLIEATGKNTAVQTVVATAALAVLGEERKVAPGVVYEGMVEMYVPGLEVKHLWFIAPFQWEDEMARVELEGRTLLPLLGVPITEGEFDFIKENGPIALEKLMAEKECDVFDWRRGSLV